MEAQRSSLRLCEITLTLVESVAKNGGHFRSCQSVGGRGNIDFRSQVTGKIFDPVSVFHSWPLQREHLSIEADYSHQRCKRMRLPPPSQARASFSPRSQPPPVEEPPREEQEATPPSPPPEEVNSEPSERSEPFEEEPPQGNDPPGGAAPVSESLHATSEYPASDEEETIEEEIIEEEIVTDGEETIEEIIEEEEVTVGSMKEETIHEESHSGVEETIQENMERGGDPPPSPGAPPSPGGGDVDTAADATSPSLQKKPAAMDNDLAAFMERRRKAADGGGIIDDEQTEQTEPMGNLPKDEEVSCTLQFEILKSSHILKIYFDLTCRLANFNSLTKKGHRDSKKNRRARNQKKSPRIVK